MVRRRPGWQIFPAGSRGVRRDRSSQGMDQTGQEGLSSRAGTQHIAQKGASNPPCGETHRCKRNRLENGTRHDRGRSRGRIAGARLCICSCRGSVGQRWDRSSTDSAFCKLQEFKNVTSAGSAVKRSVRSHAGFAREFLTKFRLLMYTELAGKTVSTGR
jgi:hypothetical protein